MKHITAFFSTRETADFASEHLLQQHGVERSDIFLEPARPANSEGQLPFGGDHADGRPDTGTRTDGALMASIKLSVDTDEDRADEIRTLLVSAEARLAR
ncbi:hypothetical protein HT136_04530 [Novosphingobium profundi]|uniref:hypothetical protein n=1 Tax=Novosphingobium profundi TaxID=1774954 RepID=UPI001BDA633B|nr:hypothetical protein [Novosphingobium profundi]MBT0667630.1 hypothetical protein [Novosphingobium profundi]